MFSPWKIGIKNPSHSLTTTNTHSSTSSFPTNFLLLPVSRLVKPNSVGNRRCSIQYYENSNYLCLFVKVGTETSKQKMQRTYEWKICQHKKKNAFASFKMTKIFLI